MRKMRCVNFHLEQFFKSKKNRVREIERGIFFQMWKTFLRFVTFDRSRLGVLGIERGFA
jgi:hypothetical protein